MASFLERFYPFVPVWAQNVGISLYGLAWRRERLGGDFERYVAEFRERDRWPPERMAEYVNGELRQVLLRAFDAVPHYRECWAAAGITREKLLDITPETLHVLPITAKQDLRTGPERFVAEGSGSHRRLRRYYSSGSTGTPVTSICTPDDHRRFIAAREVRSFGWAGTSLRQPRSMIGGRMVVPRGIASPPYYRYNRAEKQVYFSAYHIAPDHVPNYVEGFNRHRPRVLTGYAYSHYLLARMMLEQGLCLNYEPDALILGSEKLTPEMKRVMRAAFRARAYEEYGAVENCVLATECEEGRLHVSPDFGILEMVGDNGLPVPRGQEGRVLCTGLLNHTQLLIRYDIGDVAAWSDQPCSCGRHALPVLKEIVGRLEDVVIGPDGREMVRFHGIFVGLAHVIEGQVIQEALDRFTVRVVTVPGFGEADRHTIRQRFADRLGPVHVTIEPVADIPRTERGKFRAVVSCLARPSADQCSRPGEKPASGGVPTPSASEKRQ